MSLDPSKPDPSAIVTRAELRELFVEEIDQFLAEATPEAVERRAKRLLELRPDAVIEHPADASL